MATVDKTVILYWWQGEPVYSSVQNAKELSWKTGRQLQVAKTLEWNIRTIYKSFEVIWDVGSNLQDQGVRKANFWAIHTGEPNSGQVIRFRSAINPNVILFESAIESNVKGQIQVFVSWDSPLIQSQVKVTQTIYSDWKLNSVTGLPSGTGYNTIRPTTFISKNSLPFYVFHEYASTKDLAYAIRYLGYVKTPFKYYNGPKRPYKIEDIIEAHGSAIFQTNFSGKDLNVTIRFRNGSKVSGILPKNAALVVVKKDDATYQVGYIPYEGLPAYGSTQISIDATTIATFFKPLQ